MHTPSTYTYTYLHFLNGRPVFVEVKVLSHALSYQSLSSPAALPVASNQRNSAKGRGRRLDAGPCQEGRQHSLLCPCCCGGSRVHHSHSPNSGGHLEKILDTSKINNRQALSECNSHLHTLTTHGMLQNASKTLPKYTKT
jgi:hypothetical protein